jgi:hypothetical protein
MFWSRQKKGYVEYQAMVDDDKMGEDVEIVRMEQMDAGGHEEYAMVLGSNEQSLKTKTNQVELNLGTQVQIFGLSESEKMGEGDDSDQERRWEAFMKGGSIRGMPGRKSVTSHRAYG